MQSSLTVTTVSLFILSIWLMPEACSSMVLTSKNLCIYFSLAIIVSFASINGCIRFMNISDFVLSIGIVYRTLSFVPYIESRPAYTFKLNCFDTSNCACDCYSNVSYSALDLFYKSYGRDGLSSSNFGCGEFKWSFYDCCRASNAYSIGVDDC